MLFLKKPSGKASGQSGSRIIFIYLCVRFFIHIAMYTSFFKATRRHFCLFWSIFIVSGICAQSKITMSDAILKGRSVLAPGNLRQLQWIPGTPQFTHVVKNQVVRVNAPDLKTDTIALLNRLNEGLVKLSLPTMDGLPAFTWTGPDTLWFRTEKNILTWSATEGVMLKNNCPVEAENVDIHPKTFQVAYTLNKSLHLNGIGKETVIASSEAEGIVYGTSVHRDEFGINKGTFFSPFGRYLAFYRMDESMVTPYPIYVLDSMPAQQRMIRYPFAGAKSHHVTIGVFDIQTEKTIYLQTGIPADQFLTNVSWTPDERFLLVAVVNREQNHLWLKQFDAETGVFLKTLLEETNEKWVEPEKPAAFVPGSSEQFIWQSEKEGYNHLYLCDLTGKMLRKISAGPTPVTNFYGFSTDGFQCFYQIADETGLNRYVYAADLKTGVVSRLSQEEGTHQALINSTGEWILDVFSNLATPRFIYVQPVARPDKQQIIYGARNPLEEYSLGLTRLLTLTSPGGFPLNARIVLPPDFSSNKKYPAILYVYNGPHVQLVTNSWLGGADVWMHRLAQEGFVVFSVDGSGAANRGFAFESAVHRQLGTLEIADQMTGVDYLCNQVYIDSTRIGVYGWSYGGFMTTSLMSRPEGRSAFKCGVAGGPVIDWRMYEIMYTERYMDTPQENPDGYDKNSLFKYIDRLSGRLLMIHGSSDDVVLWQHSLRYIRECVRKGKQIDSFVYPEHLHNVAGKDRLHLFEKIERFFKENL